MKKIYYDNDLFTLEASVTSVVTEPAYGLMLEKTIVHPQGGGQKSDNATINGVSVVKAVKQGEDVVHLLAEDIGVSTGDLVTINVDSDFRKRSSQLHTAGHLLAAVVEAAMPDLKATGGHHWDGEARVDFTGSVEDTDAFISDINTRLDGEVAAATPVRSEVLGDDRRTVTIGSYPPVGCGGTHVSTAADLSGLIVKGVKQKKGRVKVSYTL